MKVVGTTIAAALLLFAVTAVGQSTAKSPPRTVKSDAVTINMPEGLTKEQGDQILFELRQIRTLLQQQQRAAAPQAAVPNAQQVPETVSMAMSSGWHALGRADAPVTLVEFTDYQCPFCKQFHSTTFAELKKAYIDTGRVRFITRDLPLEFHANAAAAAKAAKCAGDQGKFWEMRDLLISHAEDLAPASVSRYAETTVPDISIFRTCMNGDTHNAETQKDVAEAGTLAISGTPTFILGKVANGTLQGKKIVGALPYAVFEAEINKLIAQGK